jgi:hypothetical protein
MERCHHAPKRETNSLARACHALVRGRQNRTQRPSVKAKDTDEPTGEARVDQNLADEHRSKSKDFDPKNLTKNNSKHGGGSQ